MNPRPRLILLENVPGLADKDKTTGRSNLDAVRDALASHGFLLVSKTFNATDTGIPCSRPRLYMAAVAGLSAEEEDNLTDRIHGNLASILYELSLRPNPLSEFLLDAYMPDGYTPKDMITDWMPELCRRQERRAMNKKAACPHSGGRRRLRIKSKMGKRSTKGMTWAACPQSGEKHRYLADLNGNPWFGFLTDREKDLLLLNLCQHPYPGPQDGVVLLMTSAKFSRIVRGGVSPCQVPNALFWMLGHNRLQTGAEALMLQGVDLVDIPSFGIGSHSSRFLQDLAGNAFCVYQFVAWLLACLPQVARVSQ